MWLVSYRKPLPLFPSQNSSPVTFPAPANSLSSVASDVAWEEKYALPKTPPLDQLLHVNVCFAKSPSDFYVHVSDRADRPITEWAVTKLAKEVNAFYQSVAAKSDPSYNVTDRLVFCLFCCIFSFFFFISFLFDTFFPLFLCFILVFFFSFCQRQNEFCG